MTEPVPAVEYHERTKHSPESVRGGGPGLDWANEPTPFKVYADLPSVPLASAIRPPQVPTLRAIAGTGPPFGGDRRPGLDALTQLCYLSAGVTKAVERRGERRLFRAAACTGALYHVDLYLVTGDLPGEGSTALAGDGGDTSTGVAAGVYHFDPRTLSLDVLRRGDYRGALVEAAGGEPGVASAPLTVVATSTWWANAWKYRARTYRHAFWDSGTVLANLLAVAHALSLPARVVTGFADRAVADLLGVDPAEEGPVAMVPVGHSPDPPPESPPVESIDAETAPRSPNPVHYDLVEAASVASSLPDGEAAREWRATRPEGRVGGRNAVGGDGADGASGPGGPRERGARDSRGASGPGDGERVALEPVGDERAAKTPLHRTILRRGSCREYVREALNFRKVSTVLNRATRGAPMNVRPPAAPPLQYVDAYCVVNALEGVEPGVYQYHPDAGELELLRAGEFRARAEHLALDQALAGDAALNVYFLADLVAVTDALGDRGYRVAQLEAALAAGRLYLGAYAHRDLGATGLTFYDDAVTEFLSPRAAGQTPMFLWTLGRPA